MIRILTFPAIAITALLLATASPAHAELEDYPSIKLQGLDKSVGRTVTFEAKVGSTIQYGPLYIKIQACRKAPPIETPESAAFLQIWEVPPGSDESEWVFSGWMFASSPALSAMDHPVYDVWVLDCTGREEPIEEIPPPEEEQAQPEQAAEQTPVIEDSEAEPETPSDQPVEDPSTLPMDSEAELEAPENMEGQNIPQVDPEYDPNAPYNPDAPYYPQQQQSAPPQEDGIYSPSQGRVVPVQ